MNDQVLSFNFLCYLGFKFFAFGLLVLSIVPCVRRLWYLTVLLLTFLQFDNQILRYFLNYQRSIFIWLKFSDVVRRGQWVTEFLFNRVFQTNWKIVLFLVVLLLKHFGFSTWFDTRIITVFVQNWIRWLEFFILVLGIFLEELLEIHIIWNVCLLVWNIIQSLSEL